MRSMQWLLILRACARTITGLGSTDQCHAVPYVTMSNLANLNVAMRGALLSVLEVHLMCVGAGPTLDYADATAFLAVFQPAIDMVLARRLN